MPSDEKFALPESTPDIGKGFLADLWRRDKPLPKIEGVGLVFYFLKQGVDSLLALPMSNFFTMMTIAVSLFLFSGFLLVLQNVDSMLSEVGGSSYVTAYLKDDAPEKDVTEFVRELEANPQVRSVQYLSKEEALKQFQKELGEKTVFLEGLGEENPLPQSVDLRLQPDELNIGGIESFVTGLRENPVVDEVIFGSEWTDRVQELLKVFRIFAYVTLFIVLAIIVFLIANTIKLVIYARRGELEIMQLVGATSAFIRLPFIIGGVMQGVVGSILGMVLLKLAFSLVTYELKRSTMMGVILPHVTFLSPFAILTLIGLGIIIGAVGSFFALGRFMNV